MSDRPAALVTGASGGIGAQVSRRLAGEGYHVFLAGRSQDRLAAVASDTGGTPIIMDLTDASSVLEACARIRAAGPLPSLVVNSAGVFDLAPLTETTVDMIDRSLGVNLRGAFLVVRQVLPDMLARGEGLIVNIGSISGRRAIPENGAYAASKYGLRGLHEVLLEETRGTGVRASLIEPGAVDTPMWDDLDPGARPDVPAREAMLFAGDVADAVIFVVLLPSRVTVPVLQIEPA